MISEVGFLSDPELDKPMDYDSDSSIGEPTGSDVMRAAGLINGLEVGEQIAAGRFGVVYVATHTESGIQVALKQYYSELRSTISVSREENSELHRIFFVDHPFITKLLTVSHTREVCYGVMELAHCSVQNDIEMKGPYNEERLKVIVSHVVKALEFLHNQNICHGNLHTHNILVYDKNLYKISDMVNSDLLSWLPSFKSNSEFFHFVAPELRENLSRITQESDLWSFGVCLFVMATGAIPSSRGFTKMIESHMRNGMMATSNSISPQVAKLVEGTMIGTPSRRMKLEDVRDQQWLVHENHLSDANVQEHERLLKKVQEKMQKMSNIAVENKIVKQEIVTPKVAENPESITVQPEPEVKPRARNLMRTKPTNVLSLPEILPKKYNVNFKVFVMENVREEWDPDVTRVEKCYASGFGSDGLVLRIVIPAKDDLTSPSILERCQEQYESTRQRSNSKPDSVVDMEYGDYALMNFSRNGTGLEPVKNIPKFMSNKQARSFYFKADSERLWVNLGIVVCSRCIRAGTDSKKHDQEMCLYKLYAEATDTDEVLFLGLEDSYYVRNCYLKFRSDGGRAGTLTRFKRGSLRILRSGYQRLLRTVRRRPTSTSSS